MAYETVATIVIGCLFSLVVIGFVCMYTPKRGGAPLTVAPAMRAAAKLWSRIPRDNGRPTRQAPTFPMQPTRSAFRMPIAAQRLHGTTVIPAERRGKPTTDIRVARPAEVDKPDWA